MKSSVFNWKSILLLTISLLVTIPVSAQKQKNVRVRFETDMGNFTIELFNDTPFHRDNFVRLVNEGYYDGVLFHRVIDNFMVQTGDPDSRNAKEGVMLGEGGPGYDIDAEIRLPQHFHLRGAVAAAREGDDVNPERKSSGSQFYVVWGKKMSMEQLRMARAYVTAGTKGEAPLTAEMIRGYQNTGGTPHLDGSYTVFGRVVKGLKVIGKIEKVKTDRNDRPLKDVHIRKAYVVR